MVMNKSPFLVLIFSLLLSFGLLCSSVCASDRKPEDDPREQFQQCQRRCEWETRGGREQEQCEQRCERQFKEQQKQQEERQHGRGLNPEDPQRKYEECQQRCEQQEYRQRPQCQERCERQFREQQKQQEERQHGRGLNPEDPQRKYEECQQRCEQQEYGQRPQCQERCERQFREQQKQQEERQHGRGLNPEDPQRKYEECQQRCEQQEYRQRPQCQERCERQFREQQKQQEERQHGRGLNPEDPQRKYEECQQRCEQQEYRQRPQCQERCERQFREQQQRQQEEESQRQYQECQQRCQEQEQGQKEQQRCQRQCREQYEPGRDADEDNYRHRKKSWNQEEEGEEGQQRNNPYYFPYRRSFQTRFRDEEGNFKVLQRFAEKSPLLKGINNFRLAQFKVNPHTFVLPHHCDFEAIYFVTNGKGTVTFVNHENRESYNVEFGTVLRIPAGSAVYMVNQDNKEKLRIAVFAQPVNAPGKFEEFFPAGNGNPPSYLQVFSNEVLEAVFNTPREKLEQVFQRQGGQPRQSRRQGVFRRVEPEQIRSMSQQASSPRRGMERLAFNLMSQSPVYSNQNGRFYEASPEEFKQLQNLDVAIAATKINEGAIFVPHYNSRATVLVLVTEGSGYVEMACPHLSRQSRGSRSESEQEEEEEERSGEYQKVRARLSAGDVFVVPAGHPVTFFASKNQNLRTINFGINAQNNQRIFVAGKKNLMRQMDSEAKQIAFGAPSRLIDEVFNNPQESYFMSFSQQRQREDERKGSPLASFLDFTRLF